MASKRKVRRVIVIILLSIVFVAAILLLTVPVIAEKKIQKAIIEQLESTLYVRVNIEDIDLKWRKGELIVTNLQITGMDEFSDEMLMQIDELSLKLDDSAKPSFAKIQLDEVFVHGVSINMHITETGKTGWRPRTDSIQNDVDEMDESDFPDIVAKAFNLQDIDIHFLDERSDFMTDVKNLSMTVIKESTQNWTYTAKLDAIYAAIGYHFRTSPQFTAEGTIYVRDTAIEVFGTQWINQLQTEFTANVNKQQPELSQYSFSIPQCDYREFLSVAHPILDTESEKFEATGTVGAMFSMQGDLSYLHLPAVDCEMLFEEAELTNLENDSSIYINASASFNYHPDKGISGMNMSKYAEIRMGNQMLNLNLQTIQKNGSTYYTSNANGSLNFNDLNAIINSSKYHFSGDVFAKGDVSGYADTTLVAIDADCKLNINKARITNNLTGTDLTLDIQAAWKDEIMSANIGFTRSSGITYTHQIKLLGLAETAYLGHTATLEMKSFLPRLSLTFPDKDKIPSDVNFAMDSAWEANINRLYPKLLEVNWEVVVDSLNINQKLIEDVSFTFIADSAHVELHEFQLNHNEALVEFSAELQPVTEGIHQLHITHSINRLNLKDGENSDVLGIITADADVSIELLNNGMIHENGINGYVWIIPEDMFVHQDNLSALFKKDFTISDAKYIPVKSDTLRIDFVNSDIEILPFTVHSGKSYISGTGNVYSFDSLDVKLKTRIDTAYQTKSLVLVLKGLSITQRDIQFKENEPIVLGVRICGKIDGPDINLKILKSEE